MSTVFSAILIYSVISLPSISTAVTSFLGLNASPTYRVKSLAFITGLSVTTFVL